MSDQLTEFLRSKGFHKMLQQDELDRQFRRHQWLLNKDGLKRVIATPLPGWVRLADYVAYLQRTNQPIPDDIDQDALRNALKDVSAEDIYHCQRVNKIIRMRKERLKRAISEMFNLGTNIFVTLTFRDDVLDSTSEETRRRYVTRALKKMSSVYVANIDYGETTEREHYHAIVVSDKIDFTLWDYGFIFAEKCTLTDASSAALAGYVDKFVNHALKEGTRRRNVIYSKPVPTDPDNN